MSSDSNADRPELEVHSDEDWKERVKEEDARRDAEAASTQPTSEGQEPSGESEGSAFDDIDPSRLPPASFPLIVEMLSTQALVALGMIPEPGTSEPKLRLNLARHLIDLLGVIDQKTKGNLDEGEEQLLENTLHQLRMVYLERSRG
ncbi:hypothetical protein Mal4_23120 [Maioricimonas rarisocia]|uniref:DUF1844 domain-containing protein n=1 Tax=Maioricimonas rarisocia TaxID=2528026 RepID=A0A517Z688_9PLAN|nr:DUF1844 domain-containing protein [Maioricimonas rarisocia]QDU37993.1 hypothetical protein Mal4_23120 [Maioricimonas rarisocia]